MHCDASYIVIMFSIWHEWEVLILMIPYTSLLERLFHSECLSEYPFFVCEVDFCQEYLRTDSSNNY